MQVVAVKEEEWKIVWHHGFQGIFRNFIHILFHGGSALFIQSMI
jgi:hypothetical protein